MTHPPHRPAHHHHDEDKQDEDPSHLPVEPDQGPTPGLAPGVPDDDGVVDPPT